MLFGGFSHIYSTIQEVAVTGPRGGARMHPGIGWGHVTMSVGWVTLQKLMHVREVVTPRFAVCGVRRGATCLGGECGPAANRGGTHACARPYA